MGISIMEIAAVFVLFLALICIKTLFLSKHVSCIDINACFQDTPTQRMPITVQDVEWYINEVKKKDPSAFKGIRKVILANRPSEIGPNILGSYTINEGGKGQAVIRLFCVSYFLEKGLYTLDYPEGRKAKMGFTAEQARRMLLFTLGHEIGHNVMYRKTGKINGAEVEVFCDEYSECLDIVIDPERIREGEIFYVDDAI